MFAFDDGSDVVCNLFCSYSIYTPDFGAAPESIAEPVFRGLKSRLDHAALAKQSLGAAWKVRWKRIHQLTQTAQEQLWLLAQKRIVETRSSFPTWQS